MSLTVFNGSPRGKSSNSSVIANWFTEGTYDTHSTYYIHKFKQLEEQAKAFVDAEEVLMVFPLYVDGMPGQVKAFFEALLPYKDKVGGKKITFIIHSGFTEGIQNRALESYLNRLSDILNLENYGVIVIPGSEGFRLMPPQMTKKKSDAVAKLAKNFKAGQAYVLSDVKSLAPKERLTSMGKLSFRFFKLLGLTNMYWNSNLKKNNAYDKRFDAPYEGKPVPVTTKAYIKNF